MAWRLALDMGTNSIGWTAFSLNTSGIVVDLLDAGVRIFSDGREPSSESRVGDSLAVERRLARGARRNRDRRLRRKQMLVERLVELGLMPKDSTARKALAGNHDPYQLRADALERSLACDELGRVLFHISQRRGFLSNRKGADDDEETGKIKPKITELRQCLGDRTLGQWMNERLKSGHSIRFRGEDGDYYPDRAMYMDEFDRIREYQQPHHTLSSSDWDDLRNGNKAQGFDGIFFQRKLKPVEKGRCEFFIDEFRAHRDLPIAHEFRILQEVGNLQYYSDDHKKFDLSAEQRCGVIEDLDNHKTLSFGWLRKMKKQDGSFLFPRGCLFNLETGPRDKLNGNATAFDMRKSDMLGKHWDEISQDDQNDILEMLHDADDDASLIDGLLTHFDLSEDQARALSKYKLTSATTQLSRKFMTRCADIMRETGLRYDEAVNEVWDDDGVFLHPSKHVVDELLDSLPYYGEVLRGSVIGGKPAQYDAKNFPEQHYGKINNPTVHVALNQLRKLVNRLIVRFGRPTEIHVELVRDLKKTAKVRDEISKQNKAFAKDNDRRKKLYKELYHNQEPSGLDLKKMRLWEEQGSENLSRLCPFSGKPISAAMLFNGETEIEHILPFSRTLDNSTANLTVAIRQANRLKGNRTPHEAFANDQHADNGMVWAGIAARAKQLPKNKRWRFDADAMDRFAEDGGFIARQLTDNAYISKITKRYLNHVCDQTKIATIPGGLTAMMRGKWHLNGLLGVQNYKERTDHRHHIIDAFVVGLTDRAILNSVSRQTARRADGRVQIDLPDISPLRSKLDERLRSIVVSYKPDHGTNGKMFNETAYGIVPVDRRAPSLPGYHLVTRKKLNALSEKEISAIRNEGWRTEVEKHVAMAMSKAELAGAKLNTKKEREKVLAKALGDFSQMRNVKTIRILVSNQSATVIKSAPHKAYSPPSFFCVDIWQVPKGKPGKWKKGEVEWQGAFWSYAQCEGKVPDKNDGLIKGQRIHPAAKFITRLFKNDLLEFREGKQKTIKKVEGFSTTRNKINISCQYKTQSAQSFFSINQMQKSFVRRMSVLEDGTVKG